MEQLPGRHNRKYGPMIRRAVPSLQAPNWQLLHRAFAYDSFLLRRGQPADATASSAFEQNFLYACNENCYEVDLVKA